jgi:hypothetical protein
MLYLPQAFESATYADAAWMVRRIVDLPPEEIAAAVASTRWPDFQQGVVLDRLLARRNAIGEAFGIGRATPLTAAPVTVPLGTRAERQHAVQRFRLSVATGGDESAALVLLEEHMRRSGIVFEDGRTEYADPVSVWHGSRAHGRVLATNACERSVLVSLLERTVHPAGLARRVRRRSDDRPLRPCQPTRRTLGLR